MAFSEPLRSSTLQDVPPNCPLQLSKYSILILVRKLTNIMSSEPFVLQSCVQLPLSPILCPAASVSLGDTLCSQMVTVLDSRSGSLGNCGLAGALHSVLG